MQFQIPSPGYNPNPGQPMIAARGFALVVALLLMSFIFLLLVSFATLIHVELQANIQTRNIEAAKANAALGLQMALAQLQESTGPDQRVTARADILGEGVMSVHPTKRYWTASWNVEEGEDKPTADNATWLVSGLTSPVNPVTPLVGNGLVRVLGAGTASLDELPAPPGHTGGGIYVPSVPVMSVNDTGLITGSYGWWIGDEGIKATVNLVNFHKDEPEDSGEYRLGLTSSQSNAVASMAGLGFLESGLDSRPFHDRLSSLRQLEILVDDIEYPGGMVSLRDRYFDITHQSRGVLADVRDGGLRFDLTTELEKTSGYSLSGALFDAGPDWTLVRNFYRNFRVTPDNPVMTVQSRSPVPFVANRDDNGWPDVPGIAPVLVGADLNFGMKRRFNDPLYAAITVSPLVALANPYNVALDANTYLVRWRSSNSSGDQLGPNIGIRIINSISGNRDIRQSGSGFSNSTNLHLNRFIPHYDTASNGNSRFANDLRFKITTDFAPGEIKVFSLPQDYVYQTNPSEASLDTVLEMVEGEHFGQAELNTDDPDMLTQLELADGEEQVQFYASTRNIRFQLYNATNDSGNVVNPIRPGGSNGVHGLDVGTYPFILQTIQTNAIASTWGRVINLNDEDESLRQSLWIKGSDWLPPAPSGNIAIRQASIKAMELFNVRAPTSYGMLSTGGHLGGSPLYAAEYSNVNDVSKLDPLALWEKDAFIGSGMNPEYSMILFHVPRGPVNSMGELQHLNFAKDDHSPAFQVGNSFPNPFLKPGEIEEEEGSPYNSHWMDLPWLLNDLLWDRYFFSTLEIDSDGESSTRNSRLVFSNRNDYLEKAEALENPETVASQLLVNGQFNVNSTSVEAWKAVLLGTLGLKVPYEDQAVGELEIDQPSGAPVLKKAWPSGPESRQPGTGSVDDIFWRGYRSLSGAEAEILAGKMVDEIRARGPFRSLSEFVNRERTDDGNKKALAARGALQAAIDRSGINPQGSGNQRFSSVMPSGVYAFPEAIVYEADGETVVSGSRLSAAPGAITQADLLSLIGSFINVRSDTFVIRVYGDTRDPLLGTITARVWCEAIVQRHPEYVDPGNAPETKPGDSDFSAINQQFGRRYEITSFRWLSENEI